MDRQKVAKEAIANFDKAHPNSSLEAKNFYIAGWLDGLEEFVSLVKRMREAQKQWKDGDPFDGAEMELAKRMQETEKEVDEYLKED